MPLKSEEIHRILSICPIMLDAILLGFVTGWLAPVVHNSRNTAYDMKFTSEECSWVTSLHLLFAIGGSLLCALTIDKVGRKAIAFGSSLCCLLGWGLTKFTRSVRMLYVARMVLGIQAGLSFSIGIIIIGENSLPSQRGVFSSLRQMCYFGGMVIEYVLATYCSYDTVATTNLAIGFLYFATVFTMKETVQFLISKGRHEQAERNYRWLFSDDAGEYEQLKRSMEKSAQSSLSAAEFFDTTVFHKIIAITTSMNILICLTGYFTLPAYVSVVVPSSRTLTSNEYAICFGLIQFASSLGSVFLIDRLNRRTLMLSSLAVSVLINAATAALVYTHKNVAPIPYFPGLIFTTISLFVTIALLGLHPVAIALQTELFPQKIKPLGVMLSSWAANLTAFFNAFVFLKITATFELHSNFLYFSVMCLVAFPFVYFSVPETRGKSLIEIQQMFEKKDVKM